jgi:hypothetical protein
VLQLYLSSGHKQSMGQLLLLLFSSRETNLSTLIVTIIVTIIITIIITTITIILSREGGGVAGDVDGKVPGGIAKLKYDECDDPVCVCVIETDMIS